MFCNDFCVMNKEVHHHGCSNVWKLSAPTLVKCPQCGELKVPHQVCGRCGYYKGKEVINVAKEA